MKTNQLAIALLLCSMSAMNFSYAQGTHLDNPTSAITSSITGQTSANGGAIYINQPITVNIGSGMESNRLQFSNNVSNAQYYGGGAIYNFGGTVNIGNYVTFDGNHLDQPSPNNANGEYSAGGAIASWSAGTISVGQNAVFSNNGSNSNPNLTVGSCGGALYIDGSATTQGNLSIGDGVRFENNTASSGGAIYIELSQAVIGDADFIGNSTNYGSGGAIFAWGTDTVNNSVQLGKTNFTNNTSAWNGGAINQVLSSTMTIGADSTFTGNTAANQGGAIYNGATLTLNGATFTNNSANAGGGAIYNTAEGNITMQNVVVNAASGNAANDIVNNGSFTTNGTNVFNSNLSGTGSIQNNGNLTLGGNNLNYTGTYQQTDSASTTVTGTYLGDDRTVSNGTLNWQTTDPNALSGKLNVTGNNTTLNIGGTTAGTNGTLTLGTGSSVSNPVTVNINSGSTLNIDGGLMGLNSGDTWNGTVNLKNGTLNVDGMSGTLNATGGTYEVVAGTTASIGTGSVIENAVFVDLQDGVTLNIAGGTVNLDSNDHIIDGTVKLSSGTLNLDATPGTLIATDGNLNLIGNTIMNQYGSIASAVATNITGNAVVTNSGGTVNLDSNDTWNGQIVNNYDGIINTDNFVSNSSTASLVQTNGTLNVTNGSNLQLNSGSNISGGTINIQKDKVDLTSGHAGSVLTVNGNVLNGGDVNIDKYSKFVVQSGQFNIDVLNANGSDAVNAALINTMNGERTASTIGTLNINNQADFNIDIHARSNQYTSNDQFSITSGAISGSGIANIQDWALNGDIYGWDAPIDRHIKLGNIFMDEDGNALQTGITVTDKTTFTPIGWYQLNKNEEYESIVDPVTGLVIGQNHIGSSYTLDMVKYNPQVFRGQVTTVAQWMNQLNIADMLFTHSMVLPSFKDEDGGFNSNIMSNRYAAESPIYAPYQYSRKDGGLWYKAYGTFENLQMNNGLSRVGNNAYGALVGADLGLKELKNDWKFMPTAYIGYNGAHQTFANMGAYQNGGQLGFLGTWYKDNFIIGSTVYGGVYSNSMDVFGHTDNTFNYFAGTSAKAAYNIRLSKNWVLQPNLFVSYNYFGQQNWHSNFGQMGMMAGDLHGVNIAPGLNLIWEKDTFSTYATLQYMYNINGAVGGRAGNVNLPQMEMERGYIQYGLGFMKKFTDRASGYLQAVLRNVGRTGVGFQMGFNIYLGK